MVISFLTEFPREYVQHYRHDVWLSNRKTAEWNIQTGLSYALLSCLPWENTPVFVLMTNCVYWQCPSPGSPYFCFLTSRMHPRQEKDASYQPTDMIIASLYIQTLVTHFSWYFFFFFNRRAESSECLSSGAQLAKHRWQARCSCRLLCWYHGDQLWSISVCGHLPGTMQASQWDVHWWAKYFSRQDLTE